MTAETQRSNTRVAAEALARIHPGNEIVVTHGNGPQVGLLALQGAAYKPDEAYPLDVLGAETEGMIGYLIEQELGNLLPFDVPFATVLTMVEVDPDDRGFANPTKFVGPVYDKTMADRLAAEKGWIFMADGTLWRRVVPSPMPKRIFELRPIRWLLEKGVVVICAALFDMVDGRVARATSQVTPFGGFFDSVMDRYSDLALYMGLLVYYASINRFFYIVLTAIVMTGSVMVSYSRARAENVIPKCKVGFLERPERIVLIILGALGNRMAAVLWVIAVLSNLTVIHRMLYTWQECKRMEDAQLHPAPEEAPKATA